MVDNEREREGEREKRREIESESASTTAQEFSRARRCLQRFTIVAALHTVNISLIVKKGAERRTITRHPMLMSVNSSVDPFG